MEKISGKLGVKMKILSISMHTFVHRFYRYYCYGLLNYTQECCVRGGAMCLGLGPMLERYSGKQGLLENLPNYMFIYFLAPLI